MITKERTRTENLAQQAEEIAHFLTLSFRFSQGDTGLQSYLFGYVHLTRPQWRITEDNEEKIIDRTLDQALKIIKQSPGIFIHENVRNKRDGMIDERSEEVIAENSVLEEMANLKLILNSRLILPNTLIPLITEETLDKDLQFLTEGRQRQQPKIEGRSHLSHLLDPYMSIFKSYVIDQNGTGNPVFNQMFADIHSNFDPQSANIRELVNDVKVLWEQKHPGQKFFLVTQTT